MAKVTYEIARKEVLAWLDYKKVFRKTRESNSESIEMMEEMLVEGVLTINSETMEITHSLQFPIGDEETIGSLVYKPRLNDKMLSPYLRNVKANDGDGRLNAYVGALTNTPTGIISSLDSQDKKIAMSIAIFFL